MGDQRGRPALDARVAMRGKEKDRWAVSARHAGRSHHCEQGCVGHSFVHGSRYEQRGFGVMVHQREGRGERMGRWQSRVCKHRQPDNDD